MPEQLDVWTCRREDFESDRGRPGEEEAKVLAIRLQRATAVAGEERNGSQLGLVHLPLNEFLIEVDLVR